MPGRAIAGAIKLASNEVSLPPPASVLAAIAEAAAAGNRYPDLAVTALTARLAERPRCRDPSGSRSGAAR